MKMGRPMVSQPKHRPQLSPAFLKFGIGALLTFQGRHCGARRIVTGPMVKSLSFLVWFLKL